MGRASSAPSDPCDATTTVDVGARDDVQTRVATVEPGSTIGRYVVIEALGFGGMGEVLRAYDPKLRREVALKRVRQDRLDDEASARLLREAHAMARLNHPAVVALHDVEQHEGMLVIVMEYVEGTTLYEWLREVPRPWGQLLAAFRAVGEGLAAAHRAGIVHRDVKPTNVLVAIDGRIKVTDFGLARAEIVADTAAISAASALDLLPDVDDLSSPMTRADIMLGTPRYMAPEQGLGTTTMASDQYAFCVALWEALAGQPPFSGTWAAMLAAKRAGPPSWPRVSGVPRSVVAALLRGLSPDPAARFPTMDALLHALVIDPRRARTRRQGVAVVALLGIATALWLRERAKDEPCRGAEARLDGVWDDARRQQVERTITTTDVPFAAEVWNRVAPQLDAYAQHWVDEHTEACEATAIRGEQSAAVMDLRMRCLTQARTHLAAAVDVFAQADGQVVRKAHEVVAGLPRLSRCADVEALSAEVAPPQDAATAASVDAARVRLSEAKTLADAGKYADALALVQAVLADTETLEYPPLRTEVLLALGREHRNVGELEAAEIALVRALRLALEWGQWNEANAAATTLVGLVGHDRRRPTDGYAYAETAWGLIGHLGGDALDVAELRANLGTVLMTQERFLEAELEARSALVLEEEELGEDHPQTSRARNNLALALQFQGRLVEAEAEHRRAMAVRGKAVGVDHPDFATSRNNLANLLLRIGRLEEAEAEHRAALKLRLTTLGPDHPDTKASHNNLGNALEAQGRLADAEAEYRAAVQGTGSGSAEQDAVLKVAARSNLALVLQAQGHFAEAEAEHRAVLAQKIRESGPHHSDVARSHHNVALTLFQQRRLPEAEAEYRKALAAFDSALGRHHPDSARTLNSLGAVLLEQGQLDEAEVYYRDGLAAQEPALGRDHPELSYSLVGLGSIALQRGKLAEAIAWLERAHAILAAAPRYEGVRADAAFHLAKALVHDPDTRVRAMALAREAAELYTATDGPDSESTRSVVDWLSTR